MKQESINLFYKEGGSDKVYQASLSETKGGWLVTFAYGRRGNALVAGTKTATATDYASAKKIYDQLVRSKTSKGYTPDSQSAAFTGTVTSEKRDTGIRLQLLNEIDEAEVIKYINDPMYCAQEKYDGRRRVLIKSGSDIAGTNRKGLTVEIEDSIKKDALKIGRNFKIDGEQVGDVLYAFDILELDGKDMKNKSYDDRFASLLSLFDEKHKHISPVKTAYSCKEKRDLYDKLVKDHAEGIVFKYRQAHYTAGRPNKGGDMLKFKFYSTLSAICSNINTGKRSIALALSDKGNPVLIGNVTVYPNQEIPKIGDVVEVKYLYYFKKGSLFQPVLLGVRDDIDPNDCTVAQLKYKPTEEEEN